MKKRVLAIDYMKSFLVIGMILAHTVQFLKKTAVGVLSILLDRFSDYINLITFSGFLFCFGYACYVAYLRKDGKQARPKILITAFKILLAYYISAFSFRLLVNKDFPFTLSNCIKLLVLNDVPPYSEFLLPFFIIAILLLLFFSFAKNNIGDFYFKLIIFLSLAAALFIPYDKISLNQLALIIGTHRFASFPVVQYLPYFLMGIYFAKNNVLPNRTHMLISFLLTALFIGYTIVYKSLPQRFPPTLFWITGSAFFLYCYYAGAMWLQNKEKHLSSLLSIGSNTLFYLLLSNLILFYIAGIVKVEGGMNILIGIMIVCDIYLLNYIVHKLKNNFSGKMRSG